MGGAAEVQRGRRDPEKQSLLDCDENNGRGQIAQTPGFHSRFTKG